MKILVVEDEETLLDTVTNRLSRDGYVVVGSTNAEDAWKMFREERPDLLVLDVMLPGRSGFDLSRAIRQESKVPIIFLSARAAEQDRIRGFEVGGDDYVTKPVNLTELSARVRAILRRSTPAEKPKVVVCGNLKIDTERHEAWLGDKKLELAPKEFTLLHFFASNPGKVFTREALLDRVWGPEAYVNPRTVDVHVRWLRKHIEADDKRPDRIQTVRGVGYRFV
jgi:two-component system alkaline phosphatase synthesis response regulator PhoP